MNKQHTNRHLGMAMLAMALVAFTMPLHAAGLHPAQVLYWQETFPDKVVYHYTVVNKEVSGGINQSISSFSLGFDRNLPNYGGDPQLKSKPLVVHAPVGWKGEMERTEERHEVKIYWVATGSLNDLIKPNQSLSGFRVELPAPDPTYGPEGIFSVSFGDNTYTTGTLTPDPSRPPPPVADTVPRRSRYNSARTC